MKKIVFMMLALVGLTASAQSIKSGSKWNISNLVYEAKVNIDKTVTFTAMAEGEELAFRLTPNYSKKNEYVLTEELNADGFNPFSKTPRAKYIEKEGWKLICLYDLKGNLHNVLDGSFFGDGEKVAMGKWMQQIMGKYIDSYGDTLEIGHETIYEKGVARAEYKNIAFNGTVTGVLRISGLTDLEGMWEAVQTLDGLRLFEVEQDEYGMFKRKNQQKTLSWVNTEPRFGYANRVLLNDKQFRKMKKSTLRVMRNSILAKHGYMFSSRDLVDYFGNQPWFSPRPSNDDVNDELSLVERLNIELIKCEEATADKDRHVTEPYLAEPQEDASELTYANMNGVYDSLDENMNSVSRISLNADGTASWCMVGSLNYTEYTYRIEGNTICMKAKGVDSEEECYEYDSDTRTLKNEQGAVYYRQVAE